MTGVTLVSSYSKYRDEIPNGHNVTNPCNTTQYWEGVGHQAHGGGGDRNPFGLDFAANNHTWNKTLCDRDSDRDGRTNAEELGDPECSWVKGGTPVFVSQSHPGICEPLDSTNCMAVNSWLSCKSGVSSNSGLSMFTQLGLFGLGATLLLTILGRQLVTSLA